MFAFKFTSFNDVNTVNTVLTCNYSIKVIMKFINLSRLCARGIVCGGQRRCGADAEQRQRQIQGLAAIGRRHSSHVTNAAHS